MSTTYYRGPNVVITDDVFAVWTPYRKTFKIGELDAVHVIRGGLHPMELLLRLTTAVAFVGVIAAWPLLDTPGALLAAFTAVATPLLMTGACHRLAPRAYELRAVYRNAEVVLFSSSNNTTFGQVKRALVRAFEGRRFGAETFAGAGYGEW